MHRVFFGDVSYEKDPKWIVFDGDLDTTIKQLKDLYIDKFRIKYVNQSRYMPNEHRLYSDGINRFAIGDFSELDLACLNDLNMIYRTIEEKFQSKVLSPIEPDVLTYDEFKEYCKILCTTCGEYGHIWLSIETFNTNTNTWSPVFRYS